MYRIYLTLDENIIRKFGPGTQPNERNITRLKYNDDVIRRKYDRKLCLISEPDMKNSSRTVMKLI